MEMVVSAILGEVTTRSINFFLSKFSKPPPATTTAAYTEDRLRRLLLRAQVIVDEATARHVTNQAMLRQLDRLRDAMHRGCYILDTFRCQYSHSDGPSLLPLSSKVNLNSLKGFCSSDGKKQILEQLQEAYGNLSSMILDVEELVMFLTSYRRMYAQPYSMHLLLGNCMFYRQMEAEHVLKFLLHTEPHGSEELELEVLPIVGPRKCGKSTLVAHVCKDERVRAQFSEILFFHNLGSSTEDELSEHQHHTLNSKKYMRLLVVVELVGDLNKDAWNRLYSACKQSGTKIIVTSRSDKIVKFGTTEALTLKFMSHEAYWYYFKTLTFGSTDPETHPRLTHLAMEIATTLHSSFSGANITSCLLRNNFDIHYWHKVLVLLSGSFQKRVSKFVLNETRPVHIGRMASSEDIIIYCDNQCSSQEEVPKIRLQDVLFGSVKLHGKSEVLTWRSRIPPYYSLVHTCEIRMRKTGAAKRKRSINSV